MRAFPDSYINIVVLFAVDLNHALDEFFATVISYLDVFRIRIVNILKFYISFIIRFNVIKKSKSGEYSLQKY